MATPNRTFDLAHWINERYAIKLRRDQGLPAPWTGDPIMASVRFCNVHREDDKVTQWLAVNWRPHFNEVWQILLARVINNVPTLEALLPHLGGLGAVHQALRARRAAGHTIFGNAYTVSTNGRSMDKVDYIIGHVVQPAKDRWPAEWPSGSTLEGACIQLCTLNGVSTFMAGQIIADLKNTQGHPLLAAPDWFTWAAPGPGSLRGLEAYFGRPVRPSGFTAALAQCYAEVNPLIADYVPPIHMQDFQNCLCEFSKYVRVKEGGHARNRYTPPAAG